MQTVRQPSFEVSEAERLWALAAHASGALLSFAGPLAVHLLGPRSGRPGERGERGERGEPGEPASASAWYSESLARALNFQLVVFGLWILTVPFGLIPLIGWIPNALLLVANAILSLMAAIQTYDSKLFRYPVTVRLFPR